MSSPLHRSALDALGDGNRRAIVEILADGASSVQQIADRLPISRPAVSRHLRLLKEAGLVADRPDGTRRVYELRAEGVDAIREYFAQVWGQAVARFRLVAENSTHTVPSAAPLVVEFQVDVPTEQAFDVWTRRCATWWPSSHTLSGDPAAITFEPRAGGRIVERGHDGQEHAWGEVLDWEPPGRLRYLWHLFFDRSEATEVEITFTPAGAATAVRLEQRGWERLGAAGQVRKERTRGAWAAITAEYARAC
jgi:DNA-binding transcriptional ArsR family regulator/uncharacterized protein YndB with AHSA1/START domain